jgi:hypothetical protein
MYSTVTNLVYVGATKTMYPESWKIAHFTTSVRNSYLYIKIAFSSHLGGLSDGFIPSLVRNTVYIICSRKTKNPQLSRSCTGKEKLDPETVSITSLVLRSDITSVPKSTYIASMEGTVFTPAAARINVKEAWILTVIWNWEEADDKPILVFC